MWEANPYREPVTSPLWEWEANVREAWELDFVERAGIRFCGGLQKAKMWIFFVLHKMWSLGKKLHKN